jgi:hypothetical protein
MKPIADRKVVFKEMDSNNELVLKVKDKLTYYVTKLGAQKFKPNQKYGFEMCIDRIPLKASFLGDGDIEVVRRRING